MVDKKDWKRFGNYFCIGRKEGKSGLPIIKIKKSKSQNDIGQKGKDEKIASDRTAERSISKQMTSQKNIPSFLKEPNLQFPETEHSAPVDLVIGFDMGTAWTKIVIQDTARRRAMAVSFGEYGSDSNPFLLPTRLGLLHGHLALCKREDPQNVCKDLKISLIEKPEQGLKIIGDDKLTITGCELAAAFISIVLRYARHWFITSQAAIYRNNLLRWQMNLGIPVKNYDDKHVKEAFHNAALAGWYLSEQKGEITLTGAKTALKNIKEHDFHPGIHRDYINVVPEVAAEVAGYAYSDMREEGLHLLVDIGAATLDVSTFILNTNNGENRYGFLSADIGRYGAFELHRSRLEAFRIFINSWLSKVDGISETLEPVPESYNNYVPPQSDIPNFDETFIKKATIPITKVIVKTKRDRDPNSEAWVNGLPLFLCGGGSLAKFYSEKLLNNVIKSMDNFVWEGFRLKQIPIPEKLEAYGLRSNEYHRLAVAYGLSFQYDNIGIIVPPSEIDDILPEPRRDIYEGRFIDRDLI